MICFKAAMTDILLLLLLLNAQTIKVSSQPYQADSNGKCHNENTEYLLDGSNLCCKKCLPGQRLKQECTETTETVCEPCPKGQYIEGWNYSPNCFSCNKCKSVKGLQYVQNCSSTTRSKCGCQPGMYCIIGFDDPYCGACSKYNTCKAGYGVSVQGTADSDVKCERCPNGTFSDAVSYTDRCRPHTDCRGRIVVRKGDATSDTTCESEVFISNLQIATKEPHPEILFASAMTTTVSDSKAPHGPTDSTLSPGMSVSEAVFNHSTKSLPPSIVSDSILAATIASAIGITLLFIIIIVLFLWKTIWRKDAARFQSKVDANGNCETSDKVYFGETQLTSFTEPSPEQQLLLEKGEAYSDQSQSSNNTETLTRTDGCSSYESIGPLQSNISLHNPHSAPSEPMTLLSNTEPVTTQTSIPSQSSSPQPTSPQIISPVTNVNITFHIGNVSDRTPSVMHKDLVHVDPELPFGEEEESFSIPQQEAGKQSLMSVQENESYSAQTATCISD